MGSPLSPLSVEIFMNNIETIIHNNKITNNILYWYRYVDDIFTCFTGTSRQLDTFLEYLYSLHKNVKFTMEIKINDSLNFLDLTITRISSEHSFSIYHKPSHTDITT